MKWHATLECWLLCFWVEQWWWPSSVLTFTDRPLPYNVELLTLSCVSTHTITKWISLLTTHRCKSIFLPHISSQCCPYLLGQPRCFPSANTVRLNTLVTWTTSFIPQRCSHWHFNVKGLSAPRSFGNYIILHFCLFLKPLIAEKIISCKLV